MLVPVIALYVWWMPQTRQYEFYFLLTPLFHSLQYLAFVYKAAAEIGELGDNTAFPVAARFFEICGHLAREYGGSLVKTFGGLAIDVIRHGEGQTVRGDHHGTPNGGNCENEARPPAG